MIMRFILSLLFIVASFESFAYKDFNDLLSQAKKGIPEAQYNLGRSYTGIHKYADYEQALYYLREASKQGYAKATSFLKNITSIGYSGWGDIKLDPTCDYGILAPQMISVLSEYSDKNDPAACLFLAHSYFNDDDYEMAVKFYRKTLDYIGDDNFGQLGDTKFSAIEIVMDAASQLGYCYEHGLGVPKDLNMALAYFELLGGYLHTPDPQVCAIIKTILQRHQNPTLNDWVGECGGQTYDVFFPISGGSSNAIRCYTKAVILYFKLNKFDNALELIKSDDIDSTTTADNGWIFCVSPSNLWVAESYYKGLGRPKNINRAFRMFNYIANSKGPAGDTFKDNYPDAYADACYRLYECYALGLGTSKNASEAQYYFKEALRFGSSSAIYDDQRRYEITSK